MGPAGKSLPPAARRALEKAMSGLGPYSGHPEISDAIDRLRDVRDTGDPTVQALEKVDSIRQDIRKSVGPGPELDQANAAFRDLEHTYLRKSSGAFSDARLAERARELAIERR